MTFALALLSTIGSVTIGNGVTSYDFVRKAAKQFNEGPTVGALRLSESYLVLAADAQDGPVLSYDTAVKGGATLTFESGENGIFLPDELKAFLPTKSEVEKGWMKKRVVVQGSPFPYELSPAFPTQEDLAKGWLKKKTILPQP